MADSLAQKTARGTLWTSAAIYGGKALVLVTTVILARLLSKDDFGIVAIALVVISFLEVLQDLGIGAAVIYEAEEDAAHTAFWLGLLISAVLCALTVISAPLVAAFFAAPAAVPLLRVLGLSFPLFALRNIHEAMLRRSLDFKRRFWPEISQTLGKGVLSIGLALLNFGAWSLVLGQIGGAALAALAYWIVAPWRPQWRFERARTRALLHYGTGIVIVNALAVALAQIDYVFIGRYLGTDALGVYSVAFRIPDLILMQFCWAIAQVIFPVYARMRDDEAALARGFIATTRFVALVTVPLGLGIALVSRPFVLALFTDRWVEAIPVMQSIAIYALFLSLSYNAGDVYKAQGRPGILSWLSFVRLVMLLPGLWWATTVARSIVVTGWTHAVIAALGGALSMVVAAQMLKVPVRELLIALRPAFVGGLALTVAVLAVLFGLQTTPPLLQLLAAVAVGALSYVGTLWLIERPMVEQASATLRGVLARRSA